ncbi:hypothetical protein ACIOZM_14690 [Pseudomonas sp. NPDC087346]|uniref:glycosyltransferase family 39 protein n=1 Tax=Pseudomonas sp. NPDC087346 TaxID=3364438 RepID=UPI003805935B
MKLSPAVPTLYPSQASVLIERTALAAVSFLALFVRFYSITVPAIWYDEAYSLLLARETPARIWTLTVLDVHPPLYYVLLHYWIMVWSDSALPARALSVLADVGTLLLCIKFMSLVSTRRATWIAALLLALLPISVRYSQEVRMYSLLGFWLMAATLALVCWTRAPDQKRYALIYVLLMEAAFYTHYFAGLCVLVHWLFWWQSRAARVEATIATEQWIVANSAIVFLYLPWIPNLIKQIGNTGGDLSWIEPVTMQGALTLVWQFTVMGDYPISVWQLIPFLWVLVCVATVVVSGPRERDFRVLIAGYFLVPLIILYLVALFFLLFVPRYLAFCAPGIAMVTAVALDIWGKRPVLLHAGLLLCVVSQLHGLTMVYRQADGLNGTAPRADSSFGSLVEALNQQARPGDEVIVADVYWFPTFAYYSKSGIVPKFETHSSIDDFLKITGIGPLSLIDDPVMSSYIDGITVLDCRSGRVWWITDLDSSREIPLFAKGRTPSVTLAGSNISAYLFTPESMSAPSGTDTCSSFKPPPHPAAQNCPPGPSATSANRTRRSLRQ